MKNNYRLSNRELTLQEAEDLVHVAKAHHHLLSSENKGDYYGKLADFTEKLKSHYSPAEMDGTLMVKLARLSSIDNSLVPCTRVDFNGDHSFGGLVKSLYIEFNQGQEYKSDVPIIIENTRPSEIHIPNITNLLAIRKFPCSQSPLAD